MTWDKPSFIPAYSRRRYARGIIIRLQAEAKLSSGLTSGFRSSEFEIERRDDQSTILRPLFPFAFSPLFARQAPYLRPLIISENPEIAEEKSSREM